MQVLIVDDDPLMAELLETLLSGTRPDLHIRVAHSFHAAMSAWQSLTKPVLLLLDWSLPDGDGLTLLKTIRRHDQTVPVLIVSGRSDRESVTAAAHYGVSGYITKPFEPALVRSRLDKLLPAPGVSAGRTLEEALREELEHLTRLSGHTDSGSILELMAEAEKLSADGLARRWQRDLALVARLLDVANGVSLRRSGEPVNNLRDAITVMGVDHALQQALALSLDASAGIDISVLSHRARQFHGLSLAIADKASELARAMGLDERPLYLAGLMSRVGEVAVLDVLQRHIQQCGELTEQQVDRYVQAWAQEYGNRLKVSWKLPLAIRELSGATHFLPKGVASRDKLAMRLAAMLVAGQEDTEECQRLRRLAGLSEDKVDEP
jgi:DNA-binding response OmpR family regulator